MTTQPTSLHGPSPINEAEAIFLPFFVPKLDDETRIRLQCGEGTTASWQQSWDCCVVKGSGKRVFLHWEGQISLQGYTAIRCFTAYAATSRVSGWALINGHRVDLFQNEPGDKVPVELTSPALWKSSEDAVLSEIELELSQESGDIQWNLYWIGLVDLQKEPRLDPPLPHPEHWHGLLNPSGLPGLNQTWIGSTEELLQWKKRFLQAPFLPLRHSLETEARLWEEYEPESHLREFLPVEENLYRYVRVRDRGRPVWDHPVAILALAGFLLDRPEWTQRAARILLCMAWTPKWFEGPIGSFDWHHICFVESHTTVAALFALQFMGDSLTPEGRKRVIDKVEEAWPLIDEKCREPGYRWYMNQGIVFNAARIIVAAGLWTEGRGEAYRSFAEESWRDYQIVMENYLTPDGHCCEGPHYFSYSMGSSIPSWFAVAKLRGVPLETILPPRFRASSRFAEAMTVPGCPEGKHLPICSGAEAPWRPGLLALLAQYGQWENGGRFLQKRFEQEFRSANPSVWDGFRGAAPTAWDVVTLLALPDARISPPETTASPLLQLDAGLASFSWESPQPGKLLITAERASTGHYHCDRGGVVLYAGGKKLLPDPGITNYSHSRASLMKDPDWHNLARPAGLQMFCHNRPEEFRPHPPQAKLVMVQDGPDVCRFEIDLGQLYGPLIKKSIRHGLLHLDPAGGIGRLVLRDEWEFTAPHALEVYFQSYPLWNVKAGPVTKAEAGNGFLLSSSESSGEPLSFAVLSDRVDWDFQTIHTLKFWTPPRLAVTVTTDCTFALS